MIHTEALLIDLDLYGNTYVVGTMNLISKHSLKGYRPLPLDYKDCCRPVAK